MPQERHKPVILRGWGTNPLDRGWSLQRLRRECGHGKLNSFAINDTCTRCGGFSGGWPMTPLRQFVDAMLSGSGNYGQNLDLRCHCPGFLGAFEVHPFFAGDMLPFADGHSWPSLLIGPPGTRSSLHTDNGWMPFWLTVLQGRKRFRVVALPNWQRHLAQDHPGGGGPLYVATSGKPTRCQQRG